MTDGHMEIARHAWDAAVDASLADYKKQRATLLQQLQERRMDTSGERWTKQLELILEHTKKSIRVAIDETDRVVARNSQLSSNEFWRSAASAISGAARQYFELLAEALHTEANRMGVGGGNVDLIFVNTPGAGVLSIVKLTSDLVALRLVVGSRRKPDKPEVLRVLYLTAASEGDIRVDEEIRRVTAAVRSATHRDQISIAHMPAATRSDLLDGMVRVKPHVIHFSGHASCDILLFDSGSEAHSGGEVLIGTLFARAIASLDQPPKLVVLNACHSSAHASELLNTVAVVIGMTKEIGDLDAMTFSTRFYSALAEGESVSSAFEIARTQMLMNGLESALLPQLDCAADVDPSRLILVVPPSD